LTLSLIANLHSVATGKVIDEITVCICRYTYSCNLQFYGAVLQHVILENDAELSLIYIRTELFLRTKEHNELVYHNADCVLVPKLLWSKILPLNLVPNFTQKSHKSVD